MENNFGETQFVDLSLVRGVYNAENLTALGAFLETLPDSAELIAQIEHADISNDASKVTEKYGLKNKVTQLLAAREVLIAEQQKSLRPGAAASVAAAMERPTITSEEAPRKTQILTMRRSNGDTQNE